MVEIKEQAAVVELEGVTKEVNIDLVPEVKIGDYLLLHSGCAIKKINQKEAEQTLQVFQSLAQEGKS